MRVVGINGILTDGSGSVDRMLGELSPLGWETVDVALPIRGPAMCRLDDVNMADAFRVLQVHQPGDMIVAHSRGGLVANFLSRIPTAKFSYAFLFAPAMESDREWGPSIEQIYVIHNPDDPALKLGSALAFSHPFGDLGLVGYDGPSDPRIKNFPCNYSGHSDYFLPAEIIRWARYISGACRPQSEGT